MRTKGKPLRKKCLKDQIPCTASEGTIIRIRAMHPRKAVGIHADFSLQLFPHATCTINSILILVLAFSSPYSKTSPFIQSAQQIIFPTYSPEWHQETRRRWPGSKAASPSHSLQSPGRWTVEVKQATLQNLISFINIFPYIFIWNAQKSQHTQTYPNSKIKLSISKAK